MTKYQSSVVQFVHMQCMEEPSDEDLLQLGLTQEQIAALDKLGEQRCESRYSLLLEAIDLFIATKPWVYVGGFRLADF